MLAAHLPGVRGGGWEQLRHFMLNPQLLGHSLLGRWRQLNFALRTCLAIIIAWLRLQGALDGGSVEDSKTSLAHECVDMKIVLLRQISYVYPFSMDVIVALASNKSLKGV